MKSKCLVSSVLCFLGFNAVASSDIHTQERFDIPKFYVSPEWEQVAREAADSYDMSYETFLREANKFLIDYKREHPGTNYPLSVEDLAIYKKPDYSNILKKIERLNAGKPESEKIDIKSLIAPVPMFSVPLRY